MKGYNILSILYGVLLLGAALVSPSFAEKAKVDKAELDRTNTSVPVKSAKDQIVDMKTIDDAELARTNFPVTGTSIIKPISCVEKNGICEEIKQDRVTSDKLTLVSSPTEINTSEGFRDKSVMIGGDTAFKYGMGPTFTNHFSGTITSVNPR
jgi:hypothetical protein